MDWRTFLFSTRGRFNRARYWTAVLCQYGVLIAVWVPAIAVLDRPDGDVSGLGIAYILFAIAISVACIVAHVVAQVKRFHDRDKPWPWILIGFIPYIGGLWLLIELGMLPGTRGRNRFGPDPLGNDDEIVDVFGPPTPLEGAPPADGPLMPHVARETLPGVRSTI